VLDRADCAAAEPFSPQLRLDAQVVKAERAGLRDEHHARFGVGGGADRRARFILSERFVRQRWWLFVIAILAFAAEWGWRLRRGLP